MNHEVIEMKINEHDEKILELDKRMDKNDKENAEFKIQIKHLCETIQGLTSTMKWFIGILVGAFISFFFYVIQQGIFK
jgi:F0F1-type ATP synthase assembly protein I